MKTIWEHEAEDGRGFPVGVMDSGIGGLSVLRELLLLLPGENYVYAADQGHMPYGTRSPEEIREYCAAIAAFFLSRKCKLVVVACNTASAAALRHLRRVHPDIPFVGMEPAVKPAARLSKTGKVGILATRNTLQGELLARTAERFAGNVEVYRQPCPGLAEAIENPPADPGAVTEMLRGWIDPLVANGVDCLVLACTHYPLIIDRIRALAGPGVEVLDPGPAIARRVEQLLAEASALNPAERRGRIQFRTTGVPAAFDKAASAILDMPVQSQGLTLD